MIIFSYKADYVPGRPTGLKINWPSKFSTITPIFFIIKASWDMSSDRLVKLTGTLSREKDCPLKLKTTLKWKDNGIWYSLNEQNLKQSEV